MRFEWLFIGYLLMFQIPYGNYTILPFLGFLIMLYATLRLQKFEIVFKKSTISLSIGVVLGLMLFGIQFYASNHTEPYFNGYNILYNLVRFSCEICEMVSMFFIYIGVKTMGNEACIPALEKHSSRNMAVMFIFLLTEVVMTILLLINPQIFKGYEIIQFYPFVIGVVWRIMNLWMIITCYLGLTREE